MIATGARPAATPWVSATAALLVVAGLVSLWVDRPGADAAVWALVVGAGYAVVGVAVLGRPAARPFLLTAAVLLVAPLVRAAGLSTAASALVGVSIGVLIPAGLLGLVRPDRMTVALRTAEAAVLGCGAAVAVTLLLPSELAWTVAWAGFATALVVVGWLLFEHTAGRRAASCSGWCSE